jgi:hypothetical protein
MDWVEMFAPVVFEPYRRRAWPATGSLLLDDVPFRIAQPNGGTTRIAFRVFCAMEQVCRGDINPSSRAASAHGTAR